MPASRLISQVSFGGNAINNPTNYSWEDYGDYPDLDVKQAYVRMNITYLGGSGVYMQVTGLVVLNEQGFPLLNANNLVYLPCPPECF